MENNKREVWGVIYKLRCKLTNKFYVGLTTDWNSRMKFYRLASCKEQPKIYNALKEHGRKNFDYQILCECYNQEELQECEVYFIRVYNSYINGYNSTPGGNGFGRKHTEEAKIKISQNRKGKHSGKDHILYGKSRTDEFKEIMRKRFSGERNNMYGRYKEKNHFYGKHHTEESKRLMGEKNKNKTVYKFIHKSGDTFGGICYDFKTKYNLHNNISSLVNGKTKIVKGWSIDKD